MLSFILLSLLNAGLLAIPIGATAGVLAGIDAYRSSNGQTPLFTGGGNDGGEGGGDGGGSSGGGNSSNSSTWKGNDPNTTVVVGGVTISEYCQQYATVTVNTTGQNYTLNPNQWGWEASDGGGLCMNVTTNNNDTYATNVTAPHWSATWQYDEGSTDQPVHAYPNIQISGDVLPAQLSGINDIQIDVRWTYADRNVIVAASNTTKRAVTKMDFNANVAIDMFFDADADIAGETSNATYEVMVWFAQFGYADPIGWSDGIIGSEIIEGVNFTLYNGTNDKDQYVLTWIAADTTASFHGTILPLITSLADFGLAHVPTTEDYIGYLAFGSEAYYSNYSVTFDVPALTMEIS